MKEDDFFSSLFFLLGEGIDEFNLSLIRKEDEEERKVKKRRLLLEGLHFSRQVAIFLENCFGEEWFERKKEVWLEKILELMNRRGLIENEQEREDLRAFVTQRQFWQRRDNF